jgi:geranylgeranyl diphosphate synthase type I
LFAGCAIELLHNYSLVHDDIEDADTLRHGRETVWARYGMPHGINAGDMLCSISYLALMRTGTISDAAIAARLTETLLEANYAMCIGQGQDIAFEARDHVAYDEYLAMITGKTAALFGAACEMGAIVAGLPREQQQAYAAYGRAYGRAFQIRDDILGTWGAVSTTGKPSGADITRRKWCFPVVWALSQPPSSARSVIARAYVQQAPLDDATVNDVVRSLEELGARHAADQAAAQVLAEAALLAEHAAIDRNRALHHLFEASATRLA